MKHNHKILLYMAGAVALALLVYYRRKIFPPAVYNWVDSINVAPGTSPAVLIYQAALSRLQPTFSANQAALLAALMVAQSKLESGNYTSDVYNQNNNAFGYKYVPTFYQTGMGIAANDGGNYGAYASIQDSARDVARELCEYPADFAAVASPAGYAQALKAHDYYGEAESDYASDLTQLFTTNIS